MAVDWACVVWSIKAIAPTWGACCPASGALDVNKRQLGSGTVSLSKKTWLPFADDGEASGGRPRGDPDGVSLASSYQVTSRVSLKRRENADDVISGEDVQAVKSVAFPCTTDALCRCGEKQKRKEKNKKLMRAGIIRLLPTIHLENLGCKKRTSMSLNGEDSEIWLSHTHTCCIGNR